MDGRRWHFLIKQIKKNKYKKGVEIGVKAGRTTWEILKVCKGVKMWAIDPWVEQDIDQKNEKGELKSYAGGKWNQGAHDQSERVARQRLGPFGDRCTIIKDFSINAAEEFDDNSLDFVFIDGDHSYDGCKGDIYSWLRKVRSGGMILGHDIDWPGVEQAVKESFGEYGTAKDHVWYVTK
jgi:hypothetical protein